MKKYIVLNFAYGTGPYLRTTDLAIAFNNELEKRGKERMGIIVPWIYGEKQKKIMLEEFTGHEKNFPGEILLDAKLGAILKSIFFGDSDYETALSKWVDSEEKVSKEAHNYLSGVLQLETFGGQKSEINGQDIILELNRSPRIRYDITASYFTSFGYIGEILEKAQKEKAGLIDVKPELLKKGVETANRVESKHRIYCIAYPATFSALEEYTSRYNNEILVPPIGPEPLPNNDVMEQGIYVTVTGIPGLERLYNEASVLGLKLYSNDTEAVKNSIRALPEVIPNKNILFQFARSGWSSVWLSMIVGTPFVFPEFDPKDDPEIYFNNKAVEKMGIGISYNGQPLQSIIERAPEVKSSQKKMKDYILEKWGRLDGTKYCAEMFVDDFLKNV